MHGPTSREPAQDLVPIPRGTLLASLDTVARATAHSYNVAAVLCSSYAVYDFIPPL